MREIETTVRSFIVENFLFGNEDKAPAPQASFLEMRLIDSTGVLELVQFLEETYGVKIQDSELTPDNLDSLEKIASFIERKQAA